MTPRQLHLNAFLMTVGHHEAAWRLPESDPYAHVDVGALRQTWPGSPSAASSTRCSSPTARVLWGNIGRRPAGGLEPTILLTALAASTEHIGLIATASTTYNEPVQPGPPVRLARPHQRRPGRLEHRHHRRAPTPPATSASTRSPRTRERYERAAEFVEVALKLWDSWEDDAVVADKAAGVWGDDTKVHPPDHIGAYFQRRRAPLNVPRSPQGHPLLVQAGSSEDGKEFAARYAEAVFTAQQTLEDAQAFYADLKRRASAAGRDPDRVKVLPGIVPAIGSTEARGAGAEEELDG